MIDSLHCMFNYDKVNKKFNNVLQETGVWIRSIDFCEFECFVKTVFLKECYANVS